MRLGSRLIKSEGGPHAHATGAFLIQTRWTPQRTCGTAFGGPQVKESLAPMRWVP